MTRITVFQTHDADHAAGRRRFTLFPPDAIRDLYVGPIDHTLAGQPLSLAVGRAPGPTDGQVSADAVQRYREGRVKAAAGGAASAGTAGGATTGAAPTPGT